MNQDLLLAEVAAHPYPLLFATVSGAHLYGFPSPDSDYDLRGVHLLPLDEVLGLLPQRDTVEVPGIRNGIEIDLVTHDAAKFLAIAARCLNRHQSHHCFGFAATQRKLFLSGRGGGKPRHAQRILPAGVDSGVDRTQAVRSGEGEAGRCRGGVPCPGVRDRLTAELEAAAERSRLPVEPGGARESSDLLARIRRRA